MVKSFYLSLSMLVCVMLSVVTTSCSKDDEPKTSNGNSIVGTWTNTWTEDDYGDDYVETGTTTLVFKKDNTGSYRLDVTSRSGYTEQMEFDWTLTTAANGQTLLTVIYKSGDKYLDDLFEGNYDQWTYPVTVAGNTLSIQTESNYVMIFRRK